MRKKILVIDDDCDLHDLLSFNLERAGYCVATAVDGIEGLEKAISCAPDLILLDLMMPEMNGFSVCETLRRRAGSGQVPIVIMTAMAGEFARLSSLEAGADAYVAKPFGVASLLSLVDAMLSGRASSATPDPQRLKTGSTSSVGRHQSAGRY